MKGQICLKMFSVASNTWTHSLMPDINAEIQPLLILSPHSESSFWLHREQSNSWQPLLHHARVSAPSHESSQLHTCRNKNLILQMGKREAQQTSQPVNTLLSFVAKTDLNTNSKTVVKLYEIWVTPKSSQVVSIWEWLFSKTNVRMVMTTNCYGTVPSNIIDIHWLIHSSH